MAQEDERSAAYVSFRTFQSTLDALAQGLPNQIDRSVLQSFSGSAQTQILHALKALGLTDSQGKTQPLLEMLVAPEADRATVMHGILESTYPTVFAMVPSRMSPKQLDDAIGQMAGLEGDTRRKAVAFFLHAAEFAGVPLSPHLLKKTHASGTGQRRRTSTAQRTAQGDPKKARADSPRKAQEPRTHEPESGNDRSITLKSGGTVAVSVSVDLFQLSAEDRDFVFGLIDRLQEYESTRATA